MVSSQNEFSFKTKQNQTRTNQTKFLYLNSGGLYMTPQLVSTYVHKMSFPFLAEIYACIKNKSGGRYNSVPCSHTRNDISKWQCKGVFPPLSSAKAWTLPANNTCTYCVLHCVVWGHGVGDGVTMWTFSFALHQQLESHRLHKLYWKIVCGSGTSSAADAQTLLPKTLLPKETRFWNHPTGFSRNRVIPIVKTVWFPSKAYLQI